MKVSETPYKERRSVLQDWVMELSFMQQSVLILALRGPDGRQKYDPPKSLLRWMRRCILVSALDRLVLTNPYDPRGGSFTGPSLFTTTVSGNLTPGLRGIVQDSNTKVSIDFITKMLPSERHSEVFNNGSWEDGMNSEFENYLLDQDAIPAHFQSHFMHAAEILGYKHPDVRIRKWWFSIYERLVKGLHLNVETEQQLDYRLGDSREQWESLSEPATIK